MHNRLVPDTVLVSDTIDYHVHVENGPYTEEWLSRFIETGVKRGLRGIGFVEHGHRFLEARGIVDSPRVDGECTQHLEDFIDLISRAKKKNHPAEILLGVEMDYVRGKEERIAAFLEGYPWDFVLGSVHWDGDMPFDWPGTFWDEDQVLPIYRRYFDLLKDMAYSGLFDIAAHFDLVKVNGQRPSGVLVHEMDEVGEALEAIEHSGMSIEVSSAGLRKPIKEIYPSISILKSARSLDIPIVLSSDAHQAQDVGFCFTDLVTNASHAGYGTVVKYRRRARV
jgi:histidinol-phosphatase (PHP family)